MQTYIEKASWKNNSISEKSEGIIGGELTTEVSNQKDSLIQQTGEKNLTAYFSHAPLKEILDMPSLPTENRTKEQMVQHLEYAKIVIGRSLNEKDKEIAVTTGQLESKVFPKIQHLFKTAPIKLINVGTPEMYVDVRINPRAKILAGTSANNFILSEPDPGKLGLQNQKVEFKTGNLTVNGVTQEAGISMKASMLGPNHPQGEGPRASALGGIMGQLPTNPSTINDGNKRYIRGHLLNDNVGGPGTAVNLFPITHNANMKHESEVESKVKDWVNNEHYWVYYEVVVDSPTVNTTAGNVNYVNCNFVCEAYPLAADGITAAKKHLKKTIASTYNVDPTVGGSLNNITAFKAAMDPNAKNYTIELSFRKKKHGGVGAKELDDDLFEAFDDAYESIGAEKFAKIGALLGPKLANAAGVSPQHYSVELSGLVSSTLNPDAMSLQTWNFLIQKCNDNKAELIQILNTKDATSEISKLANPAPKSGKELVLDLSEKSAKDILKWINNLAKLESPIPNLKNAKIKSSVIFELINTEIKFSKSIMKKLFITEDMTSEDILRSFGISKEMIKLANKEAKSPSKHADDDM